MATIPFGNDLADTVKKQLECPVCKDLCMKPIFMCSNGHNVCSSCQLQLDKCPVCRVPGRPSIRNRFAEELAQSAMIPCQNADKGCKETVKPESMDSHLERCEFNFKCQFESCRWCGSVVDLDDHVRSVHPEKYTIVTDNGVVLKINGVDIRTKKLDTCESSTKSDEISIFSTTMLVFKNHLFWYHTEVVGKSSFNVQLHLIGSFGSSASPSTFSYELEFLSREGARLSYKNNVRPLKSDSCCDKVFEGALTFLDNGLDTSMIYRLKLFVGALNKVRLSTDYVRTNVFQLRQSKPANWIENVSTS